ncbi:hypothetical protein COUCH_18935 [Couchioplanes caeruleus]|uniref:hypothetical protein n=1 Tax=Couchioplanes caeruleus TaxID=56438 RepID=UPI0020BFB99D|nr:hypothetical protein [Couchioplanes caeruleus]UQU68228.1 hypothetical protein COUCH_18935 [Couchioplanes caeruleus]
MDDVRDIVINLVAAGIGALSAWSVARIRRWQREKRARQFWGRMATRGVTVVLGAQDRAALGQWEPSGLVGMGDVVGLITIQRELQEIGCSVRVLSVGSLAPEDHERDLILLGGPDTNELTRATMERFTDELSITVPGAKVHDVTLRDSVSGDDFVPRRGADGSLTLDYGLVVRTPNPLSNGRRTEVLILAGCWGYGTAGAAEAVCDSDFLQHAVVKETRFFEAVVRTAVHADAAYYERPEVVRAIKIR